MPNTRFGLKTYKANKQQVAQPQRIKFPEFVNALRRWLYKLSHKLKLVLFILGSLQEVSLLTYKNYKNVKKCLNFTILIDIFPRPFFIYKST